ncbi:MAG TPA: DUF512 domain-containing protein [Iamia sp.]
MHGQVVCCPGVNDGAVLADTLAGVLDRYPELASLCVVPLGVSRHNTEARMRPSTADEAAAVIEAVHAAQERFLRVLGRRLVFAADEYYLIADRPFPEPDAYEGFAMHEDGIGMARTFELEFHGSVLGSGGVESGFFAWADAAETGLTTRYEAAGDLGAPAEGYRAVRGGCAVEVEAPATAEPAPTAVALRPRPPRPDAPVGVLTSTYGARIVRPLLDAVGRADVRAVPVENRYFGGNVAVTGLMVGEDLARALAAEPVGHRYLLPDVCLSGGRFLDGTTPADLPRPVEVVPTDGAALRRALETPVLAGTGAPS